MSAQGSARSSWLSLFLGVFVASCNVYLDDLTGRAKDNDSGQGGIGGVAGSGAAGAGGSGASATGGGAGSLGTGAIAGSAGSSGGDRDAGGAAGMGGAGSGGFSGAGGNAGSSGTNDEGGLDAMAGSAGMDGSADLGGAGSAGQSGAAGSGAAGSAGTSGAGGKDGSNDAIVVLDSGSSDASGDQPVSGDAGAPCPAGACKRVFVSFNPPPSAANLGGLTGADAFCQSAADTRQLGGSWKAWLSDPTTSASARLSHASVPYVLLDGTAVAANWSALTSGTLAHIINISEDGTVHTGDILEVWTATTLAGAYSGRSCNAWTSNASGSNTADVGLSNQTNGDWTNHYQQYCDRTDVHLDCVEQ